MSYAYFIDYHLPDQEAEVVAIGALGWLRFRNRKTGKVNEWADLGEEDPHPIEEVREWAAYWNRHGKSSWPASWVLATPERAMRARLAVDLLRRLKRSELAWIPVGENLYRPLGRTHDLIERLEALPGDEPAVIEVDGGYRFMITTADRIVVETRGDGLGTKGPSGREEDLSVRLIGRLVEDGEVLLPRGMPAEA